jgi:cytoskeleton protein RodZ
VGSFGERLKRTRENQKVTLDQVATATKISTRMLKALEDEKFGQLPGGIFNKGFVRSYARFLHIDEAQALSDYVQASGEANQPAAAEDAELKAIAERKQKERDRQRAGSKGVPWGLTAALLLLLALGLAVWGFYSRERGDLTAYHAPAHVQRSMPASSEPPPASPVSEPTLTDVSQPPTAQPDATPATADPTPAPAAFTVTVQANYDSWLSVTADGKPVFSETLIAPASKSFQAQKQLVIRAGNVGGLDISFNGQKLSAAGDAQEAKTLTFGPSGLQAPSPKPPE